MARRNDWPLYNSRFCGNSSPTKMEVHDLDNENPQCQIDEIIAAGHAVPFGSLEEAHSQGYDNCHYCIGESKR
jgi:hypothetical protein